MSAPNTRLYNQIDRVHLAMGNACNMRCKFCYQTDWSAAVNIPGKPSDDTWPGKTAASFRQLILDGDFRFCDSRCLFNTNLHSRQTWNRGGMSAAAHAWLEVL